MIMRQQEGETLELDVCRVLVLTFIFSQYTLKIHRCLHLQSLVSSPTAVSQ